MQAHVCSRTAEKWMRRDGTAAMLTVRVYSAVLTAPLMLTPPFTPPNQVGPLAPLPPVLARARSSCRSHHAAAVLSSPGDSSRCCLYPRTQILQHHKYTFLLLCQPDVWRYTKHVHCRQHAAQQQAQRTRCLLGDCKDLGLLANFLLMILPDSLARKQGSRINRQLSSPSLMRWAGRLELGPLQVKVVARPLAGSPGNSPHADVEGNSPSSQGHPSAAGSPFSPACSPEWHSTPRWPQYANFGAHSSRPAQASTLSHVTSAAHGMATDDTASQDSQVTHCCSLSVAVTVAYTNRQPSAAVSCHNVYVAFIQALVPLH